MRGIALAILAVSMIHSYDKDGWADKERKIMWWVVTTTIVAALGCIIAGV